MILLTFEKSIVVDLKPCLQFFWPWVQVSHHIRSLLLKYKSKEPNYEGLKGMHFLEMICPSKHLNLKLMRSRLNPKLYGWARWLIVRKRFSPLCHVVEHMFPHVYIPLLCHSHIWVKYVNLA